MMETFIRHKRVNHWSLFRSSACIIPVMPFISAKPVKNSSKRFRKKWLQPNRKRPTWRTGQLTWSSPVNKQPESDHGILYEASETGTHKDRHFRRAKGWFSYNLKVKEEASQLMITVRQEDRNKAVILLNNEKLTVHHCEQSRQRRFIRLCYLLPRKLKDRKAAKISF